MGLKSGRERTTGSIVERGRTYWGRLGVLLVTTTLLVAISAPLALASNMDVVLWGQADPRWSGIHLGTSSATMGSAGCAVAAVSMIASYYGSTKNPGQICQSLNGNGGLTWQGWIVWGSVPSAAGGTIQYAGHVNYPGIPADMNKINAELDAGYPVVAGVNGYGHYVVFTGHDGGTYYINDSVGPTMPNGRKGTFNQLYGSPVANYIDGIFLYHGSHAPRYNPVAPGDAGFARNPASVGWYPFSGGLYGSAIYTYQNNTGRENSARWTFDLSKLRGTGRYRAEAYVTSTHAGVTKAHYHINSANRLEYATVNQNVLSNAWANLGNHSMTTGSAWVELDDYTGDPNSRTSSSQIAFDAVRLTYLGPTGSIRVNLKCDYWDYLLYRPHINAAKVYVYGPDGYYASATYGGTGSPGSTVSYDFKGAPVGAYRVRVVWSRGRDSAAREANQYFSTSTSALNSTRSFGSP